MIGGIPSVAAWRDLRVAGITRVICLIGERRPPALDGEPETLWLPVADGEAPTPGQLTEGCAFLDKGRGRRTFIYCWSGRGRSPTLYLAWRLRRPGATLQAEEARLVQRRTVVALTGVQRDALRAWHRLRPTTA